MIIKLIEIFELGRRRPDEKASLSLREVFVNPTHVTCLREDTTTSKKIQSGMLAEELDSRQRFTKIHLNRGLSGIDLVVVGAPAVIQEKLLGKVLLKG